MLYRFFTMLGLVSMAWSFLYAKPPIGPGFQINNKSKQEIKVSVENLDTTEAPTLTVKPKERKSSPIPFAEGKTQITITKKGSGTQPIELCKHIFDKGETIYINYDGKKIYPQEGSKFFKDVLGETEPHTGGAFRRIFLQEEGFSLESNTTVTKDCPL